MIRQSTRQLGISMNDVKRLGDCVRAVGHTVLLMEPWHDPAPLRRAYCIKEVFYAQASGARFEMAMSAEHAPSRSRGAGGLQSRCSATGTR